MTPHLRAVEPLEVRLEQFLVTRVDETEALQPAERVEPGDVVAYVATYRNTTDRSLRNVVASLPVPPGMVLMADSAQPLPAAYSLDGETFLPWPATELPGETLQSVRLLRWAPVDLAAGVSFEVALRAQVSAAR